MGDADYAKMTETDLDTLDDEALDKIEASLSDEGDGGADASDAELLDLGDDDGDMSVTISDDGQDRNDGQGQADVVAQPEPDTPDTTGASEKPTSEPEAGTPSKPTDTDRGDGIMIPKARFDQVRQAYQDLRAEIDALKADRAQTQKEPEPPRQDPEQAIASLERLRRHEAARADSGEISVVQFLELDGKIREAQDRARADLAAQRDAEAQANRPIQDDSFVQIETAKLDAANPWVRNLDEAGVQFLSARAGAIARALADRTGQPLPQGPALNLLLRRIAVDYAIKTGFAQQFGFQPPAPQQQQQQQPKPAASPVREKATVRAQMPPDLTSVGGREAESDLEALMQRINGTSEVALSEMPDEDLAAIEKRLGL